MITIITRLPTPAIAQCELTFLERQIIDFPKLLQEHQHYIAVLRKYADKIYQLPSLPDFPDSVFVEDVAIVVDHNILLTRPGTVSRQGEVQHFADDMPVHFKLLRPGHDVLLDGGDVLQTDEVIFVGMSGRSNLKSISYIQTHSQRPVIPIVTDKCLHLKTGITSIGENYFLINADWIDPALITKHIPAAKFIDVSMIDAKAANCLRIGKTVFVSTKDQRIIKAIESLGLSVVVIDITELAKAECGLSCLSLIINYQKLKFAT